MQLSRLASVTLLSAALGAAGCYAKHFPQDGEASPAPSSTILVPLVAGVVGAAAEPGDNVNWIQVDTVVAAFAQQLERAHVFKAVIHPYSDLAPVEPDVLFKVKVDSHFDRMEVKNFFKQVLVGGTLLLLQPVLPVQWDLTVHLAAFASRPTRAWSKKYEERSTYRFESTWVQPSRVSIQSWNDDTYGDAVRGLVAQIARDQELRQVGSGPESRQLAPR